MTSASRAASRGGGMEAVPEGGEEGAEGQEAAAAEGVGGQGEEGDAVPALADMLRPGSSGSTSGARTAAAALRTAASPPRTHARSAAATPTSSHTTRRRTGGVLSTTIALTVIPEDGELCPGGADGSGDQPLQPLQPLDPDPELDAAWQRIVSANLRPDTAASVGSGLDVFSRPGGYCKVGPHLCLLGTVNTSPSRGLRQEGMGKEGMQWTRSVVGFVFYGWTGTAKSYCCSAIECRRPAALRARAQPPAAVPHPCYPLIDVTLVLNPIPPASPPTCPQPLPLPSTIPWQPWPARPHPWCWYWTTSLRPHQR